MSAFETWRQHVIKWEGGESNHPSDRGGYTNKGVTIGTWENLAPKLLGIPGTAENLSKMTDSQHRIILSHFWESVKGSQISSQPVAAALAEWSWGSGPVSAIKAVQGILNRYYGKSLSVDGAIGPKTLQAINSVNGQNLFDRLSEARKQFYIDFAKANPSQQTFLKGWLNRVADFVSLRKTFFFGGLGVAVLAIGIYLLYTRL